MAIEQLDLFGNPIAITAPKKERPGYVYELPFTEIDTTEITHANQHILTIPELVFDLSQTKTIEVSEIVFVSENVADITELFVTKKVVAELKNTEQFVYGDENIRVKEKEKPQKIAPPEPTPIPAKRPEAKTLSHLQKRGRKSHKDLDASVDLINIPDEETLKQKLYYGISEVADWFNVNVSQIRFWENEFDILQPRKTKKGDRLFRIEDIKNLQLIYHLIRQRKFSIEGAKTYLKNNKQKADINFELVQSLTKFRSFLLELKANL